MTRGGRRKDCSIIRSILRDKSRNRKVHLKDTEELISVRSHRSTFICKRRRFIVSHRGLSTEDCDCARRGAAQVLNSSCYLASRSRGYARREKNLETGRQRGALIKRGRRFYVSRACQATRPPFTINLRQVTGTSSSSSSPTTALFSDRVRWLAISIQADSNG